MHYFYTPLAPVSGSRVQASAVAYEYARSAHPTVFTPMFF